MSNLYRAPVRSRLSSWFLCFVLIGPFLIGAGRGQSNQTGKNRAFEGNTEIWISSAFVSEVQNGTRNNPFYLPDQPAFDTFMRSFWGVPNVTFRLLPGTYYTAGSHEGRGNNESFERSNIWQPFHGWRILGQRASNTFLVCTNVPQTRASTKFSVIGNLNSLGEPCLENIEIANLTINANGYSLSHHADPRKLNQSNYGCVFIHGTHVYLHDLVCLGAHQAMTQDPQSKRTNSAELFVLGISGVYGRHVTNNVIERCRVINPVSNFNPPNVRADMAITTAIVIASNVSSNEAPRQWYSYGSVIRDCEVVGNGFEAIFHPLAILGSADGCIISNRVSFSRTGIYNDDALYTPNLSLLYNNISNVLIGIHLNVNQNTHRHGSVAVIGNEIMTCGECVSKGDEVSTAIRIVGQRDGSSFESVYIAHNRIRTLSSEVLSDYNGIEIRHPQRLMIMANLVQMPVELRSLTVARVESLPSESCFVCRNSNELGRVLQAYDVTSSLCSSNSSNSFPLSRVPQCALTEKCLDFSETQRIYPIASFQPPDPPLISESRISRNILTWEAESGIVYGLFDTVSGKGNELMGSRALMASSAETSNRVARVTYKVRIPKEAHYELWVKVFASPKDRSTFDVAVDGVRRWFRALSDVVPGGEWRWVALNELIVFGSEATQPRILKLSAGWHEITFWAFGEQIGLDALMLNEVNEFPFHANDALFLNFKASSAPVILQNECESRWILGAADFTNRAARSIRLESSREAPSYFISDSTSVSAGILTTFRIPKSTYVHISAVIKRANPVNDTLRVKIDGRPWIAAAEDKDDWGETGKWGETEAMAKKSPVTWIPMEPGEHSLEVLWREPGVGFRQIVLKEGHP